MNISKTISNKQKTKVYILHHNGIPLEILTSWDSAKKKTNGVPNTFVKGFSSSTEAMSYIQMTDTNKIVQDKPEEEVFTDGALKNGIGAYAGYFGINDPRNFAYVHKDPDCTVPRMEVQAIIEAARLCKFNSKILTDSAYAVAAYNNPNHIRWQNSIMLVDMNSALKAKHLFLAKVKAHSTCKGNVIVDKMCREALALHLEENTNK